MPPRRKREGRPLLQSETRRWGRVAQEGLQPQSSLCFAVHPLVAMLVERLSLSDFWKARGEREAA